MKTWNFPARKLARRLAAEERTRSGNRKTKGYVTARAPEYLDDPRVQQARTVRTKQNRSSRDGLRGTI